MGGEVGYTTSIAGTDAFPISINLGYDNTTETVDGAPYGRADSGPCGDHRDIASSDGMVTLVQTLTVNENGNVSFSVNLPGCPVLERKIGNSFDPTKDAWVIIVTDDDNLHFVEIEKIGVFYAEGTFKDIPALQEDFNDYGWQKGTEPHPSLYSPDWHKHGCLGDPDSVSPAFTCASSCSSSSDTSRSHRDRARIAPSSRGDHTRAQDWAAPRVTRQYGVARARRRVLRRRDRSGLLG